MRMKKLFSSGMLALLLGLSLVPTASFAAMVGDTVGDLSCRDGRQPMRVTVNVESFVYRDNPSDPQQRRDMWTLWAANQDAWVWGAWGSAEKYLDRGNDAQGSGAICAKRGDRIRINGMFDHGTKFLVYRWGRSGHAADQIRSVSLGGNTYSVGGRGSDCTWQDNGKGGGYDIVCKVK